MVRQVPLATPGEILATEWLEPVNLSQEALAKALGISVHRINAIVNGQHAITADMAVRLGASFGTDAQSWLNLQAHYDTEMAREKCPRGGITANSRCFSAPRR